MFLWESCCLPCSCLSSFIFRHLLKYLLVFFCDVFSLWNVPQWFGGVSAPSVNAQRQVLGGIRGIRSMLWHRVRIQGETQVVSRGKDMIMHVGVISVSQPLLWCGQWLGLDHSGTTPIHIAAWTTQRIHVFLSVSKEPSAMTHHRPSGSLSLWCQPHWFSETLLYTVSYQAVIEFLQS